MSSSPSIIKVPRIPAKKSSAGPSSGAGTSSATGGSSGNKGKGRAVSASPPPPVATLDNEGLFSEDEDSPPPSVKKGKRRALREPSPVAAPAVDDDGDTEMGDAAFPRRPRPRFHLPITRRFELGDQTLREPPSRVVTADHLPILNPATVDLRNTLSYEALVEVVPPQAQDLTMAGLEADVEALETAIERLTPRFREVNAEGWSADLIPEPVYTPFPPSPIFSYPDNEELPAPPILVLPPLLPFTAPVTDQKERREERRRLQEAHSAAEDEVVAAAIARHESREKKEQSTRRSYERLIAALTRRREEQNKQREAENQRRLAEPSAVNERMSDLRRQLEDSRSRIERVRARNLDISSVRDHIIRLMREVEQYNHYRLALGDRERIDTLIDYALEILHARAPPLGFEYRLIDEEPSLHGKGKGKAREAPPTSSSAGQEPIKITIPALGSISSSSRKRKASEQGGRVPKKSKSGPPSFPPPPPVAPSGTDDDYDLPEFLSFKQEHELDSMFKEIGVEHTLDFGPVSALRDTIFLGILANLSFSSPFSRAARDVSRPAIRVSP